MIAQRYFIPTAPGWLDGAVWKAPSEAFDVTIDWSRVLGTDTIASSTWVLPDGWTAPQAASFDAAAGKAVCWVGGGQPGTMSVLINTITTTAGRTYQAFIVAHVREVPV